MGFSEKEVFRMTLKKFMKLYKHYQSYYDFDKSTMTYVELEKKQAKDDEWL